MGLITKYLELIENIAAKRFGISSGLRMLELGDQLIMHSPDIIEATGKQYFLNKGYHHISVDINGLHGAVCKDLTRPEQFRDWYSYFDIVTNAGTTEHVEPYHSQYTCFGILHDCTKPDGIMIHILPEIENLKKLGKWRGHCNYYYSQEFFEMLATNCDYKILSMSIIDQNICVALQKQGDRNFMIDKDLFLSKIYNIHLHN